MSVPRCAVCGGPDTDGNGCEFCPAVPGSTPAPEVDFTITDDGLRELIASERAAGRAFGTRCEQARLLLSLRTSEPS